LYISILLTHARTHAPETPRQQLVYGMRDIGPHTTYTQIHSQTPTHTKTHPHAHTHLKHQRNNLSMTSGDIGPHTPTQQCVAPHSVRDAKVSRGPAYVFTTVCTTYVFTTVSTTHVFTTLRAAQSALLQACSPPPDHGVRLRIFACVRRLATNTLLCLGALAVRLLLHLRLRLLLLKHSRRRR